jgi:hypothetical protein
MRADPGLAAAAVGEIMEYVREAIRIAAPVGRVWAVVAGFGALESWCPAIRVMELEGHGIGSIRTAYLEGMVSREQLLEIDGAHFRLVYALLEPGALPLHHIRSTLQLSSPEPGITDVLWYSEADAAAEATRQEVGRLVGGFYRECLTTLKALLETPRKVRQLT